MSRSSGQPWKPRCKTGQWDGKKFDFVAKHQTSVKTQTFLLFCSSHVRFKKQKINCKITVHTGGCAHEGGGGQVSA